MILAVFGLPMELPRTEAALRDSRSASVEARWVAAMALSREDGPSRPLAVEALAILTGDSNEDVRAQAIEGLANHARSGAIVTTAIAARWLDDPSDLVRCAALSNADAFALDAESLAARMIADDSPAARATAARLLGFDGASDRADAIAELLDDPFEAVRQEAALALCRFGDERGVAIAVGMLDAGGDGALEAAEALGRSGRPIASDALRGLVDRRFTAAGLKAIAAAALARAGDDQGRAAIIRMLGAWRRQTRLDAAHAIAALPSRGLAEALAARLGEADALEASVLVHALSAIGEGSSAEALAALRGAAARKAPTSELVEELRNAISALEARGE
jgi:HEAT repeat protein